MEGLDYQCQWCNKHFYIDDMLYVNKKYRHCDKIKGWVCRDCYHELDRLDNYMRGKRLQSKEARAIRKKYDDIAKIVKNKANTFLHKWRLAHHEKPHNGV
jgi:uncharacterized protein YlaI